MSTVDCEHLRQIRTFPSLIKYLRDELDWPIESDDFEEISFDYTAEELGIDAKNAAKIEEIKQLRPLTTGQPWGIFFLKFAPKRLPVVVLRRVLKTLVFKKRASANQSDRAAWSKHDLLFVSNYGEGDARQITFAHFTDNSHLNDLDTLKVLGWDNDDTVLTLDHVHHVLHAKLRWPAKPDDVDTWRSQWRSAFQLKHREVITSSKQLATRLADLATNIRKCCNAALRVENDTGPLTTLMSAFREALIHDLEPDDFADMYAQTIAYGLLSARASRPAGLVANNLADMIPATNPFLKDLMETFLNVGGRKWSQRKGKLTGIDFDELGINDVVETLREHNIEAILRDFGNRTATEDPVIYFYEDFLKAYDAKKRLQRGVFYTPRPVVSYIVRSVHELLQTEFGLEDGLADTTTWGEMLQKHKDLKLPIITVTKPGTTQQVQQPIDPATPFVQILDPATGTATFLVEVIDIIHKTMLAKWKKEGRLPLEISKLWNDYVPKHLLPRLHGYELMMAPYAIAHMKIGLKLSETGYTFGDDERARIYLTNALEPPRDFQSSFDVAALAHEAEAVNRVKREQPITVVIGNPPYLGEAGTGGTWIAGLMRGHNTLSHQATASYFEVDGNPLNERNSKWINDDYVKFIRLSHFLIDSTGVGIHGYVTNHGYFDNPTFRGMRWALLASFDRIHVLDLHGNLKKRENRPGGGKDVNVFDIEQGVGIGLFVKTRRDTYNVDQATVHHADVWGESASKYAYLINHGLSATEWAMVDKARPYYLFKPLDGSEIGNYVAWPSIKDVMSINGTGVITKRDFLSIHFTPQEVWKTVSEFVALSERAARQHFDLPDDVRDWQFDWARKDLCDSGPSRECIKPILYRPFDLRQIYYTGQARGFIGWPVFQVMGHMLAGENLAIGTTRTVEIGAGYSHIFATREMIQHHTISIKEVNYEFPLYLYPSVGKSDGSMFHKWPEGKDGRRPNLDPDFVEAVVRATELTFVSDGRGDLKNQFGPEDVLAYLYAVFHSPEYRRRFEPMLKLDFPRVPPPGAAKPFVALSKLGHELLSLHLLESPRLDRAITRFKGQANPEVEKVSYAESTVWLDKAQTCGFVGVPEEVWNFHIGGYQVCEKWLKDRKGRTLSKDDIAHYQKIVVAISETIRLMKEIDEVIDQHGGWPGAFVTDPQRLAALKGGAACPKA